MLKNLYKRFRDRLVKRYRVELIDDVTLSQSKQFSLKPITVILIASLLFIGIVGGTSALFIYTPALHRLIPGYTNPEEFQKEREEMEAELEAMEMQMETWETYSASMKIAAGMEDSVFLADALTDAQLDSMREAQGGNASSGVFVSNNTVVDNSEINSQSSQGTSTTQNSPPNESENYVSSSAFMEESTPRAIRVANKPALTNLFSPLSGEIRRKFSEDSKHYGVDIVAEEKTLIKSVAEGFVIISEYSDDNGWVIGVASKNNVVSFYKHNSRLLKEVGSYVFAGEPVAIIGNTGENSTGPHLHFELWFNGTPVDPIDYIEFHQ